MRRACRASLPKPPIYGSLPAQTCWEVPAELPSPNHIAPQPGDEEAEAVRVPMYWECPSEDCQRPATRKMGSKMNLQQAATPQAPEGSDGLLSLAAKRKVFFASQRLLKKPQQHEELESPKEYHDAISPAEVDGGLLSLLSPAIKRKIFFAPQRLRDLVDPRRGLHP